MLTALEDTENSFVAYSARQTQLKSLTEQAQASRRAAELAIPVAIVNCGPTRGDEHARLLLDAPLGQALTELVGRCDALGSYEAEGMPGRVGIDAEADGLVRSVQERRAER